VSIDHETVSDTGALGSVRQLEGALEASATARAAAEARLEAARAEASRLLAAATEEAAAAAAERRRGVLDAAKDDAAVIHREGEERAARLRTEARSRRGALVDEALALILAAGQESEV
jgi:hypothetical protein